MSFRKHLGHTTVLLGDAHQALVVDAAKHFEGSLLVLAIDGQPLAIPLVVGELCHGGVAAFALYAVTLKADRLVGSLSRRGNE